MSKRQPKLESSTEENAIGKEKVLRVQMSVSQAQLEAIDELKELAGFKSRSDLFDQACTLLEWYYTNVVELNREVGAYDEEQGKFITPIISAIANKRFLKDRLRRKKPELITN